MGYENFTLYTEFDESGNITVDSATKVSWVDLISIQDTGYLYKDKGVDHFSGDFTHKFEIQFSNVGEYAILEYWMLTNAIGDWRDLYVADEDFYSFNLHFSDENLRLGIIEGGSFADQDIWSSPGPQASTIYFIEIVRDDDGGSHSTGRLTAYIRTGSHAGALQDTLVADCSVGKQNDYRYIYAMATDDHDNINAHTTDGFTQNLDIGEVGVTTTAPTTLAPTSLAPTTIAPTTLSPTTTPVATTPPPTTLAPTTAYPTSVVPTTPGPTSAAPTTLFQTTAGPTTKAPTTVSPTTAAPTTLQPTTSAPTTPVPTTVGPTTVIPTTLAPTTSAPTTIVPTTSAPTTLVPTSPTPTTVGPTTSVPTSVGPTSLAPTTSLTTLVPTTNIPELICVKNLKSTITKEVTLNGNLC